jgi:hypothetical protein
VLQLKTVERSTITASENIIANIWSQENGEGTLVEKEIL